MNPWLIATGVIIFVALVALIVYFATRSPAQSSGLFGSTGAAPGRASAIGTGIAGALAGVGAAASSIGSAIDQHDSPAGGV